MRHITFYHGKTVADTIAAKIHRFAKAVLTACPEHIERAENAERRTRIFPYHKKRGIRRKRIVFLKFGIEREGRRAECPVLIVHSSVKAEILRFRYSPQRKIFSVYEPAHSRTSLHGICKIESDSLGRVLFRRQEKRRHKIFKRSPAPRKRSSAPAARADLSCRSKVMLRRDLPRCNGIIACKSRLTHEHVVSAVRIFCIPCIIAYIKQLSGAVIQR